MNTPSTQASGTSPAVVTSDWFCPIPFDGRIDKHPTHKAIYELMGEIEKLPGSEQQTKVVTLAGALQDHVYALRSVMATDANSLRLWAGECFPTDENGQIHFARAVMEGIAAHLDEHFNPTLNQPLRNTCGQCGGLGYLPDACETCAGTGSIPQNGISAEKPT